MAQGFGTTTVRRSKALPSEDYETLFDKIKNKSAGEKKSLKWYRSAVKAEAGGYNKNFEPYKPNVEQTKNELRKFTIEKHLYMFGYKAKMRWLPYYDKNPLVYVLKSTKDEFWGINLHYLSPKKRMIATKKLLNGKIDVPKACFHKYLHNHVEDGIYIDLATVEWDSAILIPNEEFVKPFNGSVFPIEKKLVWDDTDETFYDKIRGQSK